MLLLAKVPIKSEQMKLTSSTDFVRTFHENNNFVCNILSREGIWVASISCFFHGGKWLSSVHSADGAYSEGEGSVLDEAINNCSIGKTYLSLKNGWQETVEENGLITVFLERQKN